ncbi:MAG: hypothetical protein ACR2FQ_05875, partial [Pseudonocardiaceae bacterium]
MATAAGVQVWLEPGLVEPRPSEPSRPGVPGEYVLWHAETVVGPSPSATAVPLPPPAATAKDDEPALPP